MSIDTIAGFGGLIFSAIIGIAIVASIDDRIYKASLEGWLHALMIIGTLGFLIFPVVASSYWNTFDVRGKLTVGAIDIVSVATIIVLVGYYIRIVRKKGFQVRDVQSVSPPGVALDDKNIPS